MLRGFSSCLESQQVSPFSSNYYQRQSVSKQRGQWKSLWRCLDVSQSTSKLDMQGAGPSSEKATCFCERSWAATHRWSVPGGQVWLFWECTCQERWTVTYSRGECWSVEVQGCRHGSLLGRRWQESAEACETIWPFRYEVKEEVSVALG